MERLIVERCLVGWKKKIDKWVFPKIGVPENGWFIVENPTKMADLGVPLFLEIPKLYPKFSGLWFVVACRIVLVEFLKYAYWWSTLLNKGPKFIATSSCRMLQDCAGIYAWLVVGTVGSHHSQVLSNIIWLVLSDEQMSKGCPFSLLNDEQMSNWLGVEHQPVIYLAFNTKYLLTLLPNNQHPPKRLKTRLKKNIKQNIKITVWNHTFHISVSQLENKKPNDHFQPKKKKNSLRYLGIGGSTSGYQGETGPNHPKIAETGGMVFMIPEIFFGGSLIVSTCISTINKKKPLDLHFLGVMTYRFRAYNLHCSWFWDPKVGYIYI